MLRALFFRLSSRLPIRIIAEEGRPYLERYYLATIFGITFYLHRFVGSDPDRGLHDHPWRWALSLILAGRYLEETRAGARTVRWVNFLLGDSFHRVVLEADQLSTWTLFIHRAKNVKPWGFWRDTPGGVATINGQTAVRPATASWQQYLYTGKDRTGEWWLDAPKGADEPLRQPADA